MTYDIDCIIQMLNLNVTINFLGIAVTIQQANGIDAFIYHSQRNGLDLNGYVLLCAHSNTGRCINKYSFVNKSNHISYLDFEYKYNKHKKPSSILGRLYSLHSAKKNIGKRVIYIALTEINYEWIFLIEKNVINSKIVFVLLDDGGGSYANKYKDILQFEIYNNPKQSIIESILRVKIRVGYLEILKKQFEKNNRFIDNRLFLVKATDKCQVFLKNEEVAESYYNIYHNISKLIPKDDIKMFEDAIVINTQCLQENNITNGFVDFELYRNVVNNLNNMGLDIVLKPHPREQNLEKYVHFKCNVYMNKSYSQESIIAGTTKKPICIVSVFSSTLLNANSIFGIPAISLAKILIKDKSISHIFKNQLKDFIKQYNEIIIFPNSINETIKIITDIKNQSLH